METIKMNPPQYYQMAGYNIAAGVCMAVLSVLAVGVRFWTRVAHRQGLKADDWLMIPAMVLTVGSGITIVYGVANHALGYPLVVVGDEALQTLSTQMEIAGKIQWSLYIVFPVAMGCVKLSFLAFYSRIFVVGSKNSTFYILVVSAVFVTLWAGAFSLSSLFWCRLKFSSMWTTTENLINDCVDTERSLLIQSITDFVADIWIILLPLPFIYRLQLSRGKKIATSFIFLLGIVDIATSLTRLVIFEKIVREGFDPKVDAIYAITGALYWQIIELGVGVLAACLPTFSIFAKSIAVINLWNSITSIGRRSRGSGSGSGSGRDNESRGSGGSRSNRSRGGRYIRSHSEPRDSHTTQLSSKPRSSNATSAESHEMDTLPKGSSTT